jgi:hypothetical protein
VIEFTIEPSLHLMQARIDSSIRFLDLVNLIAKLRKEPQWGPALQSLLIVDDNARIEKVDPVSLRSFFHKIQEGGGSGRWAVVVPNKGHKILFSDALQDLSLSPVQLQMFDDEYSALRWLKSD